MREIKFRGKRVDNGEWVCGSMLTFTNKMASITPSYTKVFKASNEVMTIKNIYDVDPATVGQYTGLHDKNGKEIYEGDILEEGPGYYFEVTWSNEWAKFKLQWRTKGYQYPEWNRGVEMAVIGNIHDNPELLERNT